MEICLKVVFVLEEGGVCGLLMKPLEKVNLDEYHLLMLTFISGIQPKV